MYYTAYHSPVGLLTLASDGQSLTGLWIQGQKYHGSVNGPMVEAKGLSVFELAEDWLDRYFSGERPDPCVLPLSPAGSDFRRLLPASMLAGAAFLLLADDLARCLLAVEIPIGILTAFAGAPFFLWLLLRRGGVRT